MPASPCAYQLLDMLTGYQTPAIVMAAHRVGLFRALGDGPASLAELACRLQVPERSLGILLRACMALDLVVARDGHYANGPLAAETLVPGQPGYLGRLVDKEAFFYGAWAELADCVRNDRPALAPLQQRARSDPETTRNFLAALDDIAALYGSEFAMRLDLDGARRLLDVGGGVGSYAIAAVRRYPELQATIVELPEVVPWAREFVAEAGLSERIAVQALDFMTDEFPAGYDAILFSNIFHDQATTVNQGLLAKAYRALPAGGRVVVYDFLLEPDRATPAASAIFAVMMVVENQWGNVYTAAEIEGWLAGAGFRGGSTVHLSPPSPMGLISGVK